MQESQEVFNERCLRIQCPDGGFLAEYRKREDEALEQLAEEYEHIYHLIGE